MGMTHISLFRHVRANGPGDARTAPPGRAFRPPRGAGAALSMTRPSLPKGLGGGRMPRPPGRALWRPSAAGRCPSVRARSGAPAAWGCPVGGARSGDLGAGRR